MARFVINNKIYDLDKMQKLSIVKKWYEFSGYLLKTIYGDGYGRNFQCDLYRSEKGNYLLVHENDCGDTVGEAIDEAQARDLLMRYDYEKYAELFGELEDA